MKKIPFMETKLLRFTKIIQAGHLKKIKFI
jgi:hypothetical protein